MRASVLVLSIFALLVSTYAAEFEREDEVIVLTDDNFDAVITENENVLIEFYAPWCGHCKKLAPEYAKAAQALKEEGSELQLAKLDATEHKNAAEKFGVRGYPTLKFFQGGEASDYNGPREAKGIVNWLKKKTGFAATKLATVEEAKKFVEDNKVAPIGFFAAEDSDEAKAYIGAAKLEDDLAYGFATSEEIATALEAELGAVVVFKQFDQGRVNFDGEWEAKAIKSFVSDNALPLFIEFSQEAAQKIFSGSVKNHLLLFAAKDDENFSTYEKNFSELAKLYKGKVLMVFVDQGKPENGRIAEFFGVTAEDPATARFIDLTGQLKKFKPEEDNFEVKYLQAYIDRFFAGDLKPHLKSEAVPEDWDSASVKVLVGQNFLEVAFDKTKNVLVEFYAPWCGHCKKLAPIWDELGDKFADRDDIVIAKMDSTANEVEEVSVSGFPTLKLFRKGDNKIEDYNGDRTLEALVEFMEGLDAEASGEEEEEAGDQKDEL